MSYSVRYHESLSAPLVTAAVATIVGAKLDLSVTKGKFAPVMVELRTSGGPIRGDEAIAAFIARSAEHELMPTDAFGASQVEQWLPFSQKMNVPLQGCMDQFLSLNTYFTGS